MMSIECLIADLTAGLSLHADIQFFCFSNRLQSGGTLSFASIIVLLSSVDLESISLLILIISVKASQIKCFGIHLRICHIPSHTVLATSLQPMQAN